VRSGVELNRTPAVPSIVKGRRTFSAALVIVLLLAPMPMATAARAAAAQGPAFDEAAIARAREVVQADPLLRAEKTIRTLRWRQRGQQTRTSRAGWLVWFAGFFAWLGQSARYLVWAAAIFLVLWVVRYVLTTSTRVRPDDGDEPFVAPTHVRDLDIRPASLPPDIGAAARALWDAGQRRAALALLYRGLLSRLAHVHSVPIADSTTEGDCLALSAAHLSTPRHAYASRLVGVWQHVVYGQEDVDGDTVRELCDGFAPALDAAQGKQVSA
jgi:hypothetical protein